jgi:hypothetical protein
MPDQEKQIIPVGVVAMQATAIFDDAEITAIKAEDGFFYASFPHLCRNLGLDQESQLALITDHGALPEGLVNFPLINGVRVVMTPCLRTDLIALWLAVVPAKRLKEEKQERIRRYQQLVADVLNRLFGPPEAGSETRAAVPADPAYAEGLAIARMSIETAELAQKKADAVEGRVAAAEARILALEARLMPREQISDEQAGEISDLVKQAAIALATKAGGGNFFGTVYGQLYRTFGITSYKHLTMAQYPKALAWLEKMIKENS